MIERPTVFVLGAGASHAQRYPLGRDLVTRIVEITAPTSQIARLYGNRFDISAFHVRLRESDVVSIDDFLEANPDFVAFGKLCIAAALTIWGPRMPTEVIAAENWYPTLWQRLHEGAATSDALHNNMLRVVTYNYDSSLERYLAHVAGQLFPDLAKATPSDVMTFVRTHIPVLHLHGTLNDQDGITYNAGPLAFDDVMTREFIERAAEGIRIIHEDEPTAGYELARNWMRAARAVHFFGFGYHPTNARRLNLQALQTDGANWAQVGGTAFGMEDAEIRLAGSAMNIPHHQLQPVDCLKYIRTYAYLG